VEEDDMTRIAGVSLAVLLAGGCGSKGDDPKQAPTDAAVSATELSVETWQADFWGRPDIPGNLDRAAAVGKAFAAGGSDVVCMHYLWHKVHRDLIVAGAKVAYPHVAAFASNLDTPVTDPADADGKVPPAPTAPPCSSAETTPKIDAMYACLMKSCSTKPDSMDGMFTDFDCYTSNCLAEGVDIITSDPKCAACGANNLEDATFAAGKEECTTNKNAGFIYDGANGTILLSKYPITKSELYVLPSTNIRRSVVRAQIDVSGKSIDVYCGTFGNQPSNFTNPYVGVYGKGKLDVEGWVNENQLQADKLVSYVKKASAGRAVVMIDTRQSKEQKEGDKIVVAKSDFSGSIDTLLAAFVPALPSGSKQPCNFCSDHPAHVGSPAYASEYVLLKDFAANATKSLTASRKESVWRNPEGVMLPLSAIYSIKATLSL
jgi:hypothetical protein